ncbi:MAG TPA: alpha-1,4-glucan--maltose-1-phosphate maltosyltransferase [Polyangiaceae bacterium]|jgi:starch synthase (maltosyl-transferring)|nr:alpha-1,4-glucan--maltose-1-phosphate maltosyltransferase [Polyangiaceae bacterium]
MATPSAPDRTARRRVLIEAVSPQVDGGLYPAKRIVGDRVMVSCDLVSDGHDAVAGALLYRHRAARGGPWRREALVAVGNDRFAAPFVAAELGVWEFMVEAWIDTFTTWRTGTARKLAAGQDVALDLASGAKILEGHAARANDAAPDASVLREAAAALGRTAAPPAVRFGEATSDAVVAAAARHPELGDATRTPEQRVVVDPERARFSAWYEMFPRSAGPAGKHGTLKDCARRLPYVAAMGFDVLYLPPIHPIGRAFRKGPNNALAAGPNDVGSPWAIGGPEGGHKAVHPELGTLEDLRALVVDARSRGIEVALDIAFQASPDHPYVKEHPEWFLHRADGSIQYAENPPKKYQDVVPFDFEGAAWESLWNELLSVFLFWGEQGVRVFRVDNPHTKPLRFWEWCLAGVKERYPEAIFLAEAFTRPKLMYALAKAGFSQSYTYFAWRHSKWEFTEYMKELTRPPVVDFYRPNFWPNTPDILPENLQFGGRSGFMLRLLLAATLSSSYGIYGPAFELLEHVAREGSEEYVDNEKYQLRAWDVDRDDSLRDVIALVNRVRREQPALQHNLVAFHPTDDENMLAFSKRTPDGANVVLVAVNLDPHHTHAATVTLDLEALGVGASEAFQVHDVLADARYRWEGGRAFVEIDPHEMPASVFVVRRRLRTEQDFDYFL